MADMRDNPVSFVGISDLVLWLRSNWVAISASMGACILLGIVYSVAVTPKYRVEALLAPQDPASSSQLLTQLGNQFGALGLGGMLGREQGSQADESVAILQSRKFLGGFIENHDLLPDLFASRWDSDSSAWKDARNDPPSVNDGIRKMKNGVLFVSVDEVTGFITLAIVWKDRQTAHDWLSTLIGDLNEVVREQEKQEAIKSLEFLREELKRTEIVDLQQALHQLSLAELQKLTIANVRDQFAVRIIDPPSLPDADDPVWPNTALILLSSAVLGLIIGVLIAISLTVMRAVPRDR